jgi:hypothetical protein
VAGEEAAREIGGVAGGRGVPERVGDEGSRAGAGREVSGATAEDGRKAREGMTIELDAGRESKTVAVEGAESGTGDASGDEAVYGELSEARTGHGVVFQRR